MAELIMGDEVYEVIGAAIEVHKELGHGFLEAVYHEAFGYELEDRGVPFLDQPELQVHYKQRRLKKKYVPDFMCFEDIVVEIKAIRKIGPEEEAQLFNYLRATGKKVGLLINFNSKGKLEWIKRVL
ncbi:MAG: GxxExxY protein [Planctomycetes bacterium]|nr:GxxExxY protein [Planctomycetota bacterium]